jgi:hypothetical protein
MSDNEIQKISIGFRLDYLTELRSEDSSYGHGHFVMSAEFRATKRAIMGEILVTGLVSEASHESPYQYQLLPLLSLNIPLVGRVNPSGKLSEIAESFSQLERKAIEQLEQLHPHLSELCLVSRRAGGLKSVRINVSDLDGESSDSNARDTREIRQHRKFEIARAHAQAHFALRKIPFEGEQIKIGKQAGFSFAELRFANLYTLARALGVKEISPRIFSKAGEPKTSEIDMRMGTNTQNELTVLVARLKRAGVIPE